MQKKTQSAKSRPDSAMSLPRGYEIIVADIKRLITESRRRALSTVNRELVLLYWQLGTVIVQQQEKANWGDAVVQRMADKIGVATYETALPDAEAIQQRLSQLPEILPED